MVPKLIEKWHWYYAGEGPVEACDVPCEWSYDMGRLGSADLYRRGYRTDTRTS